MREREKGENNQRRKDKSIEGEQKMRVAGAQVRRQKKQVSLPKGNED